jgi:DNA-binding transcriptional MerR regulator
VSDGWFLIAEFARRCRLPVSALRYYDRVGLLRPAHVDPDSGYRRYRAEQLDDAVTIARLRAVGTSPDVIALVLQGGETRSRALASERSRLTGEIRRLGDALPAALRRGVATLRARLRRRGSTVVGWGAVLPLDLDDTVTGHGVARLDGEPPTGADRLRLPGGEALEVEHRGARDTLAHAYAVLLDAAGRAGTPAVGPVVEWYPATPGPLTTTITVRTAGTVPISCRTRRG